MGTEPTGVTEPIEPVDDERDDAVVVAPLPWWRGRTAKLTAIAAAVLATLLGGLLWAFSNDKHPKDTALKPIVPSSAPATTEPAEPDASGGLDFTGGLGDASATSSAAGDSAAASIFGSTAGSAPSGVRLPSGQLPAAPALQPGPPVDWSQVIDPYVQAQRDAIAANLAGAITGPAVGAVMSGINSAAVVVGDLILYAAYTNNGGALLNQLAAALPAVAIPAPAGLGAPDFSGLSSAFAAAAAAPPIGIPSLPPPPAGLPTPEQVLSGLRALPPPGLPQLPPPPGLPTPDQVMGGLAGLGALPAIGLPALPPPPPIGLPQLPPIGLPQLPPIGLPQLPPPPPIGLPTIGFPSIGLPSITRLLGLPF